MLHVIALGLGINEQPRLADGPQCNCTQTRLP